SHGHSSSGLPNGHDPVPQEGDGFRCAENFKSLLCEARNTAIFACVPPASQRLCRRSIKLFRYLIGNFYQERSVSARIRAWCSRAETSGVKGSRWVATRPTVWWAAGSVIGTTAISP